MEKNRKRKPLTIAVIFLIGLIAILAANRYLIRHVEIHDVAAFSSTMAIATATENMNLEKTPIETTIASTPVTNPVEEVTVDDWSYQSPELSISIQEFAAGSGKERMTYFMADVVLSDAKQLRNAFADNQFGRNIIADTSEIAKDNNAIFAVNGDYYGFREDGIIIRNGILFRDEPARNGLAFFVDGQMQIYDESQTNGQNLLDSGVWNTFSFGPALLENGEIIENISKVEIDTNIGNHPIQGEQPRTGVGVFDENHFIFIVVDGRSRGYSRGATLMEFASIFKDLGCSVAYNLDGGGSATMYFMGRVVNNPLGRNKERGTSDILFIAE